MQNDLLLVYRHYYDEGVSHHIRYFPDVYSTYYEDFKLLGSSAVSTLSLYNDTLVYARSGDFREFRTMRRIQGIA